MIITGEKQLLQLKKMALAYLMYCHRKEFKPHLFCDDNKSLFFSMENEETERFIKEIDDELNSIAYEPNHFGNLKNVSGTAG